MRTEMAEQPAVLRELIARGAPRLGPHSGVVIVARGSSDHAAIYGRYLLELATGRPVALAAPSLFTRYGARTDASGWLVVGVSQSGATPEIVEVVERLRATGGRAVAITNDPGSPLAAASEVVLALGAGEERAVPATKTLTAQFAAFAVLAPRSGRCHSRRPTSPASPTRWPRRWSSRSTPGRRATSSWWRRAGSSTPPRWRAR